ncbi:MAG TPA: YqzL family protein [Bacillota bacterium]|nr:YqzL family protein [Bacillota bacterium]
MIDLTWKMFCETGNIEAYLLLKELEIDEDSHPKDHVKDETNKASVNVQMY